MLPDPPWLVKEKKKKAKARETIRKQRAELENAQRFCMDHDIDPLHLFPHKEKGYAVMVPWPVQK